MSTRLSYPVVRLEREIPTGAQARVHEVHPLPMIIQTADNSTTNNWTVSFGPFRMIRVRRLLERDGVRVQIGGRAFDILAYLLEHSGEVVCHQALLAAAWPYTNVAAGNLRYQMTMLRQILGRTAYIVNIPGRGYCFTAPLSRHEPEEQPSRATTVRAVACEQSKSPAAQITETQAPECSSSVID